MEKTCRKVEKLLKLAGKYCQNYVWPQPASDLIEQCRYCILRGQRKHMPKRTYQPKKRQRSREHGFMKRMMTKAGRNVLRSRRQKGRAKLSA